MPSSDEPVEEVLARFKELLREKIEAGVRMTEVHGLIDEALEGKERVEAYEEVVDILKEQKEAHRKEIARLREEAGRELEWAEKERERADMLGRLVRSTDLYEYLELCHQHRSLGAMALLAADTATGVNGKLRYGQLKPWKDFLWLQIRILDRLQSAYHSRDENPPRIFRHQVGMRELGKEIISLSLRRLLHHLHSVDTVRKEFSLPPFVTMAGAPWGCPDQALVFWAKINDEAPRARPRMALVIELKDPEKLSSSTLRSGIRRMDGRADTYANLASMKTDLTEWDAVQAVKVVSDIVAQTFFYMITGRVKYGIISNGESLVFLHVDPSSPNTIHYHLSEPNFEVEVLKSLEQPWFHKTAVSQALAVALLAIEEAQGKCETPDEERHEEESHKLEVSARENPDNDLAPYCTPKCLRGLAEHGPLDPNCPNFALHPRKILRGDSDPQHALAFDEFRSLINSQLSTIFETGCTPLGIRGAAGFLFHVCLQTHGYVFVGKGTVANRKQRLAWEKDIYEFLHGIQGVHIPVCLGIASLKYPYYIDVDIHITDVLLLSHAGDDLPNSMVKDFETDNRVITAIREIEKAGVRHSDVRVPNLRWDADAQKVVVIDFEHSWVKAKGRPGPPLDEEMRLHTEAFLRSAWVDTEGGGEVTEMGGEDTGAGGASVKIGEEEAETSRGS